MRRYVRFSHTLYGSYLNSVYWLMLFYAQPPFLVPFAIVRVCIISAANILHRQPAPAIHWRCFLRELPRPDERTSWRELPRASA